MIALATVSVIRVTAYYKEALSKDLAKILPFGVLAAFLIDGSFFSVDESLESLKDAKSYSEHVLYYLVFLIVLEFALRLLMGVTRLIGGSRSQRWEQRAASQRDESAGPSQPDAWEEDTPMTLSDTDTAHPWETFRAGPPEVVSG